MIDYSVFDSILDAAFVVDGDGKVTYCNDAAAVFCGSSARRIVGKVHISELIELERPDILPFGENSPGRNEPTPFIETAFKLLKGDRAGRVQLAIRPISEGDWGFFVRDVSLEEALHSKYRSELQQKEAYAKNLEKLVEERTQELRQVNQTLKAILNSLGQGFFTFDRDGNCSDVFTRACETILSISPQGQLAWKVLGIPDVELVTFRKWVNVLFDELLPFEDLRGLGPQNFTGDPSRYVTLEYYPIRDDQEKLASVVVVATDKTAEHQAQMALEEERQYASMVVKYIKNKDQFRRFLSGLEESMRLLDLAAQKLKSVDSVDESFRILHTIEGESGVFSIRSIRDLSRESQAVLEPYKGKGLADLNVLSEYKKSLEAIRDGIREFFVRNNGVIEPVSDAKSRSVEIPIQIAEKWIQVLKQIPKAESVRVEIDEMFQKIPIGSRLTYYDGLIQSVSERLGKKVNPLKVEGGDFRISSDAYTDVFASMVHAFRNAVDHGIEPPDERTFAGKSEAGTIFVRVENRPKGIHLWIQDDGRGIDPEIIREKLKEKFPNEDVSRMSAQEIIQCVAWPGFSSRSEVGEFSGRGVGLDALRTEVLKLGGSFTIESQVGVGAVIHLTLPHLDDFGKVLRSAS